MGTSAPAPGPSLGANHSNPPNARRGWADPSFRSRRWICISRLSAPGREPAPQCDEPQGPPSVDCTESNTGQSAASVSDTTRRHHSDGNVAASWAGGAIPMLENNAILSSLSESDAASLRRHLRTIFLKQKEVLYEAGELIKFVYFPFN